MTCDPLDDEPLCHYPSVKKVFPQMMLLQLPSILFLPERIGLQRTAVLLDLIHCQRMKHGNVLIGKALLFQYEIFHQELFQKSVRKSGIPEAFVSQVPLS